MFGTIGGSGGGGVTDPLAIHRDNSQPPTVAISWNSKQLTNLADATTPQGAVTLSQLGGYVKSDGSVNFTGTEIWDNGGGTQVQVSTSQILTGTTGGTTSMSSDGTIYSSDNGSAGPEHRTSIQFSNINVIVNGVTRTHINEVGAIFFDGSDNTISILASSSLISIADTATNRELVIGSNYINDGTAGTGIDFSGTAGDIIFPLTGLQIIDASTSITGDGTNMTLTVPNGLIITNGAGAGGIQTDAGVCSGADIWRLGKVVNGLAVLDAGKYVEVDIKGTLVKLAMIL